MSVLLPSSEVDLLDLLALFAHYIQSAEEIVIRKERTYRNQGIGSVRNTTHSDGEEAVVGVCKLASVHGAYPHCLYGYVQT